MSGRLLEVPDTHRLACLYLLAHALVLLFIATEVHSPCGQTHGCSKPCQESCPPHIKEVCRPKPVFNASAAICGGRWPWCDKTKTCYPAAAKEGAVFPTVLVAGGAGCLLFAVCVSLPGFATFASFAGAHQEHHQHPHPHPHRRVAIKDEQLNVTSLMLPLIVSLDFRLGMQATGWGGGIPNYTFMEPYSQILIVLSVVGMVLCAAATARRHFNATNALQYVSLSLDLGTLALALQPCIFFFKSSYGDASTGGDAMFVGNGPVDWSMMVFHTNAHHKFLEDNLQQRNSSANHLTTIPLIALIWKIVVTFILSNGLDFSEAPYLLFWSLRVFLLQLDNARHRQCHHRKEVVWRPYPGAGTWPPGLPGWLRSALRATSTWTGQHWIQLCNNLYNAIFFWSTMSHTLARIKGSVPNGIASKQLVNAILVTATLGVATNTCGVLYSFMSFPVNVNVIPDRSFRTSMILKQALLWLKIVLLRYLVQERSNDWVTLMLVVNTLLTLGLVTLTAYTTAGVVWASQQIRRDMCHPRGFYVAFAVLLFSSKAVLLLWLLLNTFQHDFVQDVPQWLLPGLPPFYLLLLSSLTLEAARYFESLHAPEDVYSSVSSVQSVRLISLWVAWCFPAQFLCNVFITGILSASLFRGLVATTTYGSAAFHAIFTLLSLLAWGAAVCMSICVQEPSRSLEVPLHNMNSESCIDPPPQ